MIKCKEKGRIRRDFPLLKKGNNEVESSNNNNDVVVKKIMIKGMMVNF